MNDDILERIRTSFSAIVTWGLSVKSNRHTEYVRADIVAEKEAEIERLRSELTSLAIESKSRDLALAKLEGEVERLKAGMYPAWRNNQAPYHRSDITGRDASGLVTIQCGSCKKFHTFYGMFRCFDCGMWLCRECCWEHLGSNRHQPHPAHLHEYMAEIERLTALWEDAERMASLTNQQVRESYDNVVVESWKNALTDANDEIGRLKAENAELKKQVACGTKWTVQDDRVFHGQEVVSWKSDTGDWAFAYGIELHGTLAMEGMVTGFASEDEAFAAAESHCFEDLRDSVLGDDGL